MVEAYDVFFIIMYFLFNCIMLSGILEGPVVDSDPIVNYLRHG